jgi:hypothetical protein
MNIPTAASINVMNSIRSKKVRNATAIRSRQVDDGALGALPAGCPDASFGDAGA